MNCKNVYAWLLAAETPAAPPDTVARHLEKCERCRQQQRRLLRLEQEVRQLPTPLGNAGAKARLLAKLQTVAAPAETISMSPYLARRRLRWTWSLTACTAAATLLLAVGLAWWVIWLATRTTPETPLLTQNPPPDHQVPPKGLMPPVVETLPPPDEVPDLKQGIVTRLLQQDLRLAEAVAPGDRFRGLAGMATELRYEAFRLAEQPEADDLPLMGRLYGRVLREGLLALGPQIPAEQRSQVLSPLLVRLQETEAEAERLARHKPPAVASALHELASASASTRVELEALLAKSETVSPLRGEGWAWGDASLLVLFTGPLIAIGPDDDPKAAPAAVAPPTSLLESLVTQGLLLAKEQDFIRRADHCNEVATLLVQAIGYASEKGDAEEAAKLGKHLETWMDRAVAGNLSRVELEGPEDPRLPEFEKVSERSTKVNEALEKNLKKAPEPAKGGLQRALEQSRKAVERALRDVAKGKGKPKGKPDHPPGPPKDKPKPPGLEKKEHKDD